MGSGCSHSGKVHSNDDRFKVYEPIEGLSDWYGACHDGDSTRLKILLPFLTFDQLNRTEENGSTCLHVACYRNHPNVVLILLICGCDRDIKNKYGLTPLQETKSDEIRNFFSYDRVLLQQFSGELYKDLKGDMFTPYNKFIIGHISLEHVYDAKEMVKAFRSTGLEKMYMIKEITANSYVQLRKIVNRCIPSDNKCYSEAIECLNKQDPFALIKLYTLETGFYRYLQKDNADFTANIFINLAKFKSRAFTGRTYRGAIMAHFDVNAWKWATKQSGRIIETQTFMSTSESEKVARSFANYPSENKVSVLFVLDFPQTCDTAIKLNKDESNQDSVHLTKFPDEKEVLVTPYTLFEVNSVDFDKNTNWYRIHLTNVPIVC